MITNYHSMLCYQQSVYKGSAVLIFDLLHEKRISKFQLYTYYGLVKRRFKWKLHTNNMLKYICFLLSTLVHPHCFDNFFFDVVI